VASDMFGVSGRVMLEAMIASQRDSRALAQMTQSRLRSKIDTLVEALIGRTGYRPANFARSCPSWRSTGIAVAAVTTPTPGIQLIGIDAGGGFHQLIG